MDVHDDGEPHQWVGGSLHEWVDSLGVDATAVECQLWLLAAVAFVADVQFTHAGLQHGLTEGNPLMRWAIGVGGITALALAKGAVLGIAALVRVSFPRYGPVIPFGVAVPWLAAVGVNAALLV
ncbi:DUF5658 family protein [Halomicrobium salinisoli]|uniref:DUF5658 family protein n=1 Tax=Halomicrobium salinisoli TaxID=2878391 RepID=UPI001CF013A8|nr:DUF5658 family protein [Halomicrobium salinisoli]